MLTVGNLLKKAREHAGKQLDEISQATKIKPHYLRKIEENDFSEFSSSTFIKGFIRSYAMYLGLDAESIVALFRRQIGEEDVPLKPSQVISKPTTGIVVSPMAIISSAVVVFFIGLFAFLLFQFYNLQQPPKFEIVQPAEDSITVDKTSYEIKGYIEANSRLLINGTQVQLRDDNTFSILTELKEGPNIMKFEGWKENVEGQKAEHVITITYKPPGKPTVSGTPTPTTTGTAQQEPPSTAETMTVSLTLTGQAWIQVVADNIQKAVGVKEKGFDETYTVKKMIEITSGRPNNGVLKVNGKEQAWKIKNGVGSLVCTVTEGSGEWKCD
jgi:cytoskeletal protein RodZ